MFQRLYALLANGVCALRTIAELHPAVFSISDWSAPQPPGGTHQGYSSRDRHATRLEAEHPSAGHGGEQMRPWPSAEQPLVERAASKLLVP